MTQKITFGLQLDGERGFHPRDALGEAVVGPLGMLAILETQLGLSGRSFSRAERVIEMKHCLQAASNGARFYELSFRVDELGTASTLLSWRDDWYEHGWDGRAFEKGYVRLQDMHDIERLAERVPVGIGQRLAAVERALEEVNPAMSIVLATPLEELPLRWRRVMEQLEAVPGQALKPAAGEGTTLRALQDALLAEGRKAPKIPWRDDGSLRIIRSQTDVAAAEWVAAQVANAASGSTVVVGDHSGSLLDGSFYAFDRPLLGAASPSAFRPPLQLMQLALRLMWAPIDYAALLSFLSHTVGPIHPRARRMLAEFVASTPGIGGDAWQRLREEIARKVDFNVAEKVMDDIAFWIEGERWGPVEGAPLAAIRDRVHRIGEYFRSHLNSGDAPRDAAWASGFAQAQTLHSALKELEANGATRISPQFLDRLVWDVTGSGASNPLFQPTAGAFSHVTDPGAVLEPFERVVWWQMGAVPLPRRYPWSVSEIRVLRESGVALPEVGEKLAGQARQWLQPIIAASDELILMLPKTGTEVHPVWLQVQACLDRPTIREEVVEGPLNVKTECSRPLAHRPLPAIRRWWHLAQTSELLGPKRMSFTGLSKLLFDPYEWVLGYAAKLKESRLLDIPGDALYGNLAHASVERLYHNADAVQWRREKLLDWLDADFDSLISEEGAILRMPGHRADLETFRTRLRESVVALHDHLRAAKVVSVETEREFEAETAIGSLQGRVDLLVTRDDGRQAVIDMKWSYWKGYREAVASGTHLQLAVYGKLIEQATGRWPAAAYYLLPNSQLISATEGFFAAETFVPGESGSLAAVWERAVATFKWRRGQLEQGRVEILHDGAQADAASLPPEAAFAMPKPDHRYDPYIHLAGWEPMQ